MRSDQVTTAVRGTLIHTPILGEMESIEDALVTIDSCGVIVSVQRAGSPGFESGLQSARMNGHLFTLRDNQYLMPGLIDLHVHAPQWPQLGTALHLPLNQWLQQYTFPLEARYADLEFARQNYESLVDALLANGTTTAMYYGTIHLEATCMLAKICLDKGQRAVVGKVAMDNRDECPEFYRDASTAAGLDGTRALIEYVRSLPGNESARVLPAVTPRFIPACTDDMLNGLAGITREYDCHLQTHCSESDWEHQYVIDRHGINDTQSLDRFRLLTDKTVLAHSNLIDEADMTMIRSRQSGIAHCPLSNIYLSNAVFPARRALDHGLKVGLGTDISGGPNPSILHNCRAAVHCSRMLEEGVDPGLPASRRGTPDSRVNYREAFWMATAGGADALGLDVGRFAEGFQFDAIVVDAGVDDTNLQASHGRYTADEMLQRIVYSAERPNIANVWVQGRMRKGAWPD